MSHGGVGSPIQVLMAEDNPDDVFLTEEALKESKLHVDLSVVENGVETMAFLRGEGPWASAPRPDLILLDLNMPRKDGREVLAEIKADHDLRTIPVVIVTTSQSEADVYRAYSLHANCYVTKPVDLDQFMRVVDAIEGFWLTVVRQPQATHEDHYPSH
jgi:chemotaxis family two-component system response regulator Rcp1